MLLIKQGVLLLAGNFMKKINKKTVNFNEIKSISNSHVQRAHSSSSSSRRKLNSKRNMRRRDGK